MQPQFGGKEKSKNENGGTAWKIFFLFLTNHATIFPIWFLYIQSWGTHGNQETYKRNYVSRVPAVFLTPFWGRTSTRPKPTFIRRSKAFHLLTLAETQNSMKSRNLVCEMHFGVSKDKIWPGGQSGLILMGGGRDCGWEHGATAAMGGSGLERDRGCDRRPSRDRRTGDHPAVETSGEPLSRFWCRWARGGPEPAGRTSKAMSTWTTLCLELPWKLKSAFSVGKTLKMFWTIKLDRTILS